MNSLDGYLDASEGAIRCSSVGAGPPIVMVHGTPYWSLIFRDIAPALAQRHHVFLLDHLGYGRSEQREGQDLSITSQAAGSRACSRTGDSRAECRVLNRPGLLDEFLKPWIGTDGQAAYSRQYR